MNLTFEEALKKGVEAHHKGRILEAEKLYLTALKIRPRDPHANHNIGILVLNTSGCEKALSYFRVAIEADPFVDQFWISYISALIDLNQLDETLTAIAWAKTNGLGDNIIARLETQVSQARLNRNEYSDLNISQQQLRSLVDLYEKGKFNQVLELSASVLRKLPNSVEIYNIQGAAHIAQNNFDLAIKSFEEALKIAPDYADAHNNMGTAQREKGALLEAIKSYKKAILHNPDFGAALTNMGNVYKQMGKLDMAIDCYETTIEISPSYVLAYKHLGNALQTKLKFDKAMQIYRMALKINPNQTEILYNIGLILHQQGDLIAAITSYCEALEINPNLIEVYRSMSISLKSAIFTRMIPRLPQIITTLLTKSIVRPADIARPSISLLKHTSKMSYVIKNWSKNTDLLLPTEAIRDISQVPLLQELMSSCPLPDIEIEAILIKVRATTLLTINHQSKSPKLFSLQLALAQQCFINEYIYPQTETENEALLKLEKIVTERLDNNCQADPLMLICLASYKALHKYAWVRNVIIPKSLKILAKQQIGDIQHEQKLKFEMTKVSIITDRVSELVQDQYEESPYPRWVNVALPADAMSISQIADRLNLKADKLELNRARPSKILIAGCGTGQQSIETAARFKNSDILAIDLSLDSLAYAERKTRELGLTNINYVQADILELNAFGEKFDLIESVGVLHHMENPLAGWQSLVDCLQPGALMRIGLYSKLGRQHVTRIRNEIRGLNKKLEIEDLRDFRSKIMASSKEHHKQITQSIDFFSASTLRDALFHVQEHVFSLSQINHHLDQLHLSFCGFEGNTILNQFQVQYGDSEKLQDLKEWSIFEGKNPRVFSGMYQFWCQKVH